MAAPGHAGRLRVAGASSEELPTGHLPEASLLQVGAGQAAAAPAVVDGATVGGPPVERRKADTAADQVRRRKPRFDGAAGPTGPARVGPAWAPLGPVCPLPKGVAVRPLVGPVLGGPVKGGSEPTLRDSCDAPKRVAPLGSAPGLVPRLRRSTQSGAARPLPASVGGFGSRPLPAGAEPEGA